MEKKYTPTPEEKEKDRAAGKKEYQSSLTKSYLFKNNQTDIKMKVIETLNRRFEELDKEADSQEENDKRQTLAVMAEIAKAIFS